MSLTSFLGIVQGLYLSHKEEDSLRTKIDVTIKDIRPEVFPSAYSVHFVPVFDSIGKIISKCIFFLLVMVFFTLNNLQHCCLLCSYQCQH